jgi:hypothetical protein
MLLLDRKIYRKFVTMQLYSCAMEKVQAFRELSARPQGREDDGTLPCDKAEYA